MNTLPLIVYHADCPDGFGAAYSAWRKFTTNAEYFPAAYHRPPPDFTNRVVYLLDFCYPKAVLEPLVAVAKEVHLIDHHATTLAQIEGLKTPLKTCILDMKQSGAHLAWKYFNPADRVPLLIKHIQDRDIWTWEMPNSEAFLAALDMLPFEFEAWDRLMLMVEFSPRGYAEFVERGAAMNEKFQALAAAHVADARPLLIDGCLGLALPANHAFAGRVGNLLAEKAGSFGVIWGITQDNTLRMSIRGISGYDVRALAERFGGGGHREASGFELPLSRLMDVVNGRLDSV
jgi:uncharacterized protein